MEVPKIEWVKNDPKLHQWFSDGSVFLVALQTGKNGGPYKWDFDVVEVNCDGDGMFLQYPHGGEAYSDWEWTDFEYFQLMEGEMPTARPSEEEQEANA